MREHCQPFRLWVLCMSDECHRQLSALGLPGIEVLKLENLESYDADLAATSSTRSMIEYYFTCTPALMTWLMKTQREIETLTYVDADLYFFASPNFLFKEFEGSSILIVPHRFSERNRHLLKWGVYNVGWVSFRRDEAGLACLSWWRRSCLEWCHDFVDGDRFADQRYLDVFPSRFAGVQICGHPGINLAPWNLDNYVLSEGLYGEALVDGKPVIFFHFHRFRRIASFLWRTSHYEYGARLDRRVRRLLYARYLRDIIHAEGMVSTTKRSSPLRRDAFKIGVAMDKLRAIASIIWRGGGLWTIRGYVF